jgi:hypothetical protein
MTETKRPTNDDPIEEPCEGWPRFCYEACPPPPEVDLKSIISNLRIFFGRERDVSKILKCINGFLKLLEHLPDDTKIRITK